MVLNRFYNGCEVNKTKEGTEQFTLYVTPQEKALYLAFARSQDYDRDQDNIYGDNDDTMSFWQPEGRQKTWILKSICPWSGAGWYWHC